MAKKKKSKARGIMGRSDIPYAQRIAMQHQSDIVVNRDHAAKIAMYSLSAAMHEEAGIGYKRLVRFSYRHKEWIDDFYEDPDVGMAHVKRRLEQMGMPISGEFYSIEVKGQSKREKDINNNRVQAMQIALICGTVAMNDEFGFGPERQFRISEKAKEYVKKGEKFLLEKMEEIGFLIVDGEAKACIDENGNAVSTKKMKGATTRPILFNTDMVKAIQDGRKTVTRRIVKNAPNNVYAGRCVLGAGLFDEATHMRVVESPIKIGDILYVRETWRVNSASNPPSRCNIGYKAGGDATFDEIIALPTAKGEWKPSIHMPKKAARIFLRVKDVRAERLQDITEDDAKAEGIKMVTEWPDAGYFDYKEKHEDGRVWSSARECFRWGLWNITIKPADMPTYGWDANPWVWVIEFEKISKGEAMREETNER